KASNAARFACSSTHPTVVRSCGADHSAGLVPVLRSARECPLNAEKACGQSRASSRNDELAKARYARILPPPARQKVTGAGEGETEVAKLHRTCAWGVGVGAILGIALTTASPNALHAGRLRCRSSQGGPELLSAAAAEHGNG